MSKSDYIIEKHIKRLGIKECSTPAEVFSQFANKYGEFKANSLMQNLWNGNYDLMYSDYDIAMVWGGAYDYNLLKHFYEWVLNNKDKFGKNILEIGCGCGFMTTFLAAVMPDKKIVSIDINKNAIEIAEKNAKKYGLKNIQFLQQNLDEIRNQQFDTIFSCRTMMENIDYDIQNSNDHEFGPADGFLAFANYCYVSLNKYAALINSCLKESGNMISIETVDRWAPHYYAWLKALYNNGLSMDIDTFSHVTYKRLDEFTGYDIGIFNKTGEYIKFDLGKHISILSKFMDLTLNRYQGWEAQLMYEYLAGDQIKSNNIQTGKGINDKKDILAKDKFDVNKIIHFTYDYVTTHARLVIYPTSQTESICRTMDSVKENF